MPMNLLYMSVIPDMLRGSLAAKDARNRPALVRDEKLPAELFPILSNSVGFTIFNSSRGLQIKIYHISYMSYVIHLN